MPNLGPFPSKEADLNLYVQAAVPYLVANKVRLLVSTANETAATAQLAVWNNVYPASQNSNTRTKSIVENKDIAKEAIIAILRIIYADIPASALTVEDRNTLNLAERSTTRSPVPVPTTRPAGQVSTINRLQHIISFANEDGTQAKPHGVRGCQIWYSIGEQPNDPSQLKFMATDTASPYTHHFNGSDAGSIVYYWLRWENTRGETGPWSEVLMATITA